MKTNTNFCVGDLMTRNLVTVRNNADLTEAIRAMETQSMSVVPVVDGHGAVCGILSTTDLISLTYNLQADIAVLPHVSDVVRKTLTDALVEDNNQTRVADVMTCKTKTVTPDETITGAAKILVENEIHHLPVVDDTGNPIGIISTMDIVRAVAFHFAND